VNPANKSEDLPCILLLPDILLSVGESRSSSIFRTWLGGIEVKEWELEGCGS
jgi:hypothetical protein